MRATYPSDLGLHPSPLGRRPIASRPPARPLPGLLRDALGFDGLVVTDALSATTPVTGWSPGARAVRTIDAGYDIALASGTPAVLPEKVAAVVRRARSDPAFAATVDVAARRVLAATARLVHDRPPVGYGDVAAAIAPGASGQDAEALTSTNASATVHLGLWSRVGSRERNLRFSNLRHRRK